MKPHTVLLVIIVLMHTTTLVNVTFFDGEWNGIVMMISNILFLIGVVFYSIEFRSNKSRKG